MIVFKVYIKRLFFQQLKGDQPAVEGYRKYPSTEDCGYPRCTHSRTDDHYHCLRDECGYGVNDESKLAQHTQRHEKLGESRQFSFIWTPHCQKVPNIWWILFTEEAVIFSPFSGKSGILDKILLSLYL